MAQRGKSGRIVVEVEPDLKRRLYSALSLSGSTLKDWFLFTAEEYCRANAAASSKATYPEAKSQNLPKVREGASPAHTMSVSSSDLKSTSKRKQFAAKFKVASLFSGCGGMDLGFKGGFEVFGTSFPNHPFEIVWANDLNAEACKTYRHNIGHEIHNGDIWDLIDGIPPDVDVLIGGFPCQDISVNGKRQGVNGTRSGLYKAMIEAIRKTTPRVFVAENVKALLRHETWLKQVLYDFGALGYTLSCKLYQAADYGVPQTRERVFIVGTAPGVKSFVPPEPRFNASTWMTARHAIGDLEGASKSPHFNHIWSEAKKSPEQGNRRLVADRPGYTIRAECHGNIQFHYRLPRRISMREAARIQSFPDKFLFCSPLRETERQVGNAVPPILAWHIANSVLKCLR